MYFAIETSIIIKLNALSELCTYVYKSKNQSIIKYDST